MHKKKKKENLFFQKKKTKFIYLFIYLKKTKKQKCTKTLAQ